MDSVSCAVRCALCSGKAHLIAFLIGKGANVAARNAHGEGVKELGERPQIKLLFRAHDALRSADLSKEITAIALSYAV
jgi:hypothetical protein